MRQLREKDAQYAQLVNALNLKIHQLERALTDAHQKRASIVEAREEELARQQQRREVNATQGGWHPPAGGVQVLPQQQHNTPHDISPALAYQPANKMHEVGVSEAQVHCRRARPAAR